MHEAVNATHALVDQPLPQWEKVLWKEQPYPDNYTDATFLQQLVLYSFSIYGLQRHHYVPTLLDCAAGG